MTKPGKGKGGFDQDTTAHSYLLPSGRCPESAPPCRCFEPEARKQAPPTPCTGERRQSGRATAHLIGDQLKALVWGNHFQVVPMLAAGGLLLLTKTREDHRCGFP
jgi:hypothetical protein